MAGTVEGSLLRWRTNQRSHSLFKSTDINGVDYDGRRRFASDASCVDAPKYAVVVCDQVVYLQGPQTFQGIALNLTNSWFG